jgi:flagellar M-ring protein FliF
MMERDPGFGVSQFVENARYQHSLEVELVRTITTLRPVRDARVHLAIPKPSAFTRQREVASASVVLDLRSGSMLERNQVDAIVHLVASSIPDLSPERVTVVDQSGRMLTLTDPNSQDALSASQFEQVRRQETSFNQRIRELLEPLTGPGRVNAEVAVDFGFLDQRGSARNLSPTIRPRCAASRSARTPAPARPGPEGRPRRHQQHPARPAGSGRARSRRAGGDRQQRDPQFRARPHPAAHAAAGRPHPPRDRRGPGRPHSAHRRERQGVMAPLDQATLARVEALIKQAVGFDEARGDSVSVMNAPFVKAPEATPDDVPLWENPDAPEPDGARHRALRPGNAGGAGAAVRRAAPGHAPDHPAAREAPARAGSGRHPDRSRRHAGGGDRAEEGTRPGLAAARAGLDAYEDRLRQAREAVKNDSKQVAQVVKDWVAADER